MQELTYSITHPFMEMFATAESDVSTNSQEQMSISGASLANPSRKPERDKAKTIIAICGQSLQDSSRKADPEPLSWKTYLQSLPHIEPKKDTQPSKNMVLPGFAEVLAVNTRPMRLKSYTTLPKWGTCVAGVLSAQPMLDFHTSAIDGGVSAFWVTPSASDNTNRQASKTAVLTSRGTHRHVNAQGQQSAMRLSQQVKLCATPAATDYKQGKVTSNALANAKRTEAGRSLTNDLAEIEVNDHYLNPDWVEQLLGLPIGWTDLQSRLDLDKPKPHRKHRAPVRTRGKIGLRALKRAAMV